ncbi:LysR family transcriptional regulator [Pseudoduganella eburnea]|uniref:LysR family transcriptional regulator n=1 Tax=Massilia eburnea TaxID=1776165 RepID=A0A6L6QAX2_9BURK|nr:TOBE domain-containing protein [Massilia eburnea]MTW09214.1 LysR family transcriptional regulator [Massilia eburnea]
MGKQVALQGEVWITLDGESFGGRQRVQLLASIAEHGSITQGAKAIGMSYKAAWDAIDAMNNLAGEPLLERSAGGKGGGGTRLTQRGAQLVDNFRRIEYEHNVFMKHLSRQSQGLADDYLLLQTMKMKTSARNQFSGTVAAIKRGAVNDEVLLRIVGGQEIVAIITHESTDSLGLREGAEAFALVKASSIILAVGEGAKLSARNQLQGTICRVQPGAVNSEVSIALPGGGTISATVTRDSEQAMELEVGMEATALFKASSVIIGVPI